MVKFALPLVALAMAASVAAAPAPGEVPATVSGTTFSFEAWVDDIIANPDTALTVDEALAAAEDAEVVGSAGGLTKRATCDPSGWKRANAKDATTCVNDLARKGGNGQTCTVPNGKLEIQMCRTGNAKIMGITHDTAAQSANCNDVARTVGKIFDSCFRSDQTIVGSQYCLTNGKMNVGILGA